MSTGSTAKKPSQPVAQRVASPKIRAAECASCGSGQTRVYKTEGRVRRCVCDNCGTTWKLTGPFADELREYAMNFADSLQKAGREELEGQKVVLIPAELATELEKEFRRLAST
jgi:hypothetical protein